MARFTNYSDEDLALVDRCDVMFLASIEAAELDSPNSLDFEALLERTEDRICDDLNAERIRRFGPPSDLPL